MRQLHCQNLHSGSAVCFMAIAEHYLPYCAAGLLLQKVCGCAGLSRPISTAEDYLRTKE